MVVGQRLAGTLFRVERKYFTTPWPTVSPGDSARGELGSVVDNSIIAEVGDAQTAGYAVRDAEGVDLHCGHQSTQPTRAGAAGSVVAAAPPRRLPNRNPRDERILPGPGELAALAPTALVLADLLTLPGRSDAEAEQLIHSLAATDPLRKD